MNDKILEFCDMLEKKAAMEAECFPVDRYFLQQYLTAILSFDRNKFLLCNLERGSNTYTVQLLLCLPELWEDISLDDILEIVGRFTNIFSYYSLIQFTHRYVEINIIEAILSMPSVTNEIKNNIIDYLISSFYLNLIKSDGDELFFKEGLYGIQKDDWIYTQQRLLLDKRIEPALTDLSEMKTYVLSLVKYKEGNVRRW
jgi:hypothetical protein